MFVETLLFLFVLLCILHICPRNGRKGRLVRNIPSGLPDWPIVGAVPKLMLPQEKLWPLFRKLNRDCYPIFKFWAIHQLTVNLRHPDDIQAVLSSSPNIKKSTAYKLLFPWLREGLLTSTGNKWQTRRKILTPAFHSNVLKKYMDIIAENNQKLVEFLKANIKENSIVDLLDLSTNISLNIICEATMGTSLRGMEDEQRQYRNAVLRMGHMILYRVTRPWLYIDTIFNLTAKGREQAKNLKILHRFSKNIITERLKYYDETNGSYLKEIEENTENQESKDVLYVENSKKRLAMLDLLIENSRNKNNIDNDGIQEEVDTFMFEGHDTTAMALCFALLLLAEHKNVQARARAEIRNILEKSNGTIGYCEIQQFQYLEMCIKEALRLYPSVPVISRHIIEDLKLSKYLIPRGAVVHMYIYDLHRDENFWPEPEKFDPNRFLPDRIKGRHPFSYLPFSAGRRNCIGQKFVMMELKAIIAQLLYHFELEPVHLAHEVPLLTDIVIRPSKEVHIKFVSIEKLSI